MVSKEREALKTQLDMKALEIGNLMERCKLLDSGHVKLTQPHFVNADFLTNKSKLNSPFKRKPSTSKYSRLKDTSVQTDESNKQQYVIKRWSLHYPLASLPKTIHNLSQGEERIVDFHTIEKAGRRGSPMLHEQISHKVFENPELLKPLTTKIGDRDLTMQFILDDIVSLQHKTESELETETCARIKITKITSTARELLLNLTVALRTISHTIRTDELRDDSEFHSDINVIAKCLCDAKPWHTSEKGVEVRRVLGLLSHISLVSSYLREYIAGKTSLCTDKDESYKEYSEQMIRYQTWSRKGHKFEMLEMFLEFITVVGAVRRSHQFSGVVCAIATIIYNVHEELGYCDRGLQYVLQIFREMISLKPLPYCYAELGKVMTIFLSTTPCFQSFCIQKSTCTFQSFLAQLQKYQHNPITRIDIVHSLLCVIECLLHQNVVPLRIGRSDSCNHCFELIRFVIQNLRKVSEINLQFVDTIRTYDPRTNRRKSCALKEICPKHCSPCLEPNANCLSVVYQEKFNDANFWRSVRRKQLRVLNAGLVFLSHLAICDPNVESQAPEIENSLHLSIQNISAFEGIGVHQNERETISRIKETFMADKPIRAEVEGDERITKGIESSCGNWNNPLILEDRCVHSSNQETSTRTNHNRSLTAIKRLFIE